MGFLALSLIVTSFGLLVLGGLIAGFGQGLGLRAGLAGIVAVTAPDQRAEVSSAFFVVAYLALSVSVIGVGVLTVLTDLQTAGLRPGLHRSGRGRRHDRCRPHRAAYAHFRSPR
jgi:hypothetical protein